MEKKAKLTQGRIFFNKVQFLFRMSGIFPLSFHLLLSLSLSACYFLSEYLPCGVGGCGNGPHSRFVCVGEYFVWFYFSVYFGTTCAGECVCVCVCVCVYTSVLGSVCRKYQVVDYFFRELQICWRVHLQSTDTDRRQ